MANPKMTHIHCPLCATFPSANILWQDDFCRVVWVDDLHYPGFCRVILTAHHKEMTDLPADQRQRLMTVVFAVEACVRDVVKPDKINLASLGNVVPHVHWHVIPRWENDSHFPDAIWAAARRTAALPPLPAEIKQQIQALLFVSLPK
jgi:diadenosine tetraphosphate (Ap4A) HIT family hydrolase